MKRRDFIKMTAAASAAMSLNGMPISAFGDSDFLRRLSKSRGTNGNIMVFINMSGGNDGLNTIIPLDRYAELAAARSNILIPQNNVLALNGTSTTGMHPVMTGLRDLQVQNLVNIVQGVGYPNPNFSHFRSSDIWSTASDSNTYLNTGWLGRSIDTLFPGAPQAYPDANFLDPLAIQIGTTVGPALSGANGLNGLAVSSVSNFYNIANGIVDPAPNTPAGHELTFIRFITQQTQTYTQVIQNAVNVGANVYQNYPNSRLAAQLKIVAELISGGLRTPIYIVNHGGFDTHDNQVDANVAQGKHAELLTELSEAINAFQTDLQLMGKDDIVAGCTMSEFGRRIKSNASLGTDHGTSAPMVFFGKKVNPTVIGTSPVLPAAATSNDNVPMQHDFRQVYSSILQHWLGMSKNDTKAVLNNVDYSTLPIFQTAVGTEPVITKEKDFGLEPNYPNPFVHHTNIRFYSQGGAAQITLYDQMGRRVRKLYENIVPSGSFEINVERGNLRAGIYYYELIVGSQKATEKMVVQ